MTKAELNRIQVYDEDDEDVGEYIAIAYYKDMDELEDYLTSTNFVIVSKLDWIIIKSTKSMLYTLGLRYRINLYTGKN